MGEALPIVNLTWRRDLDRHARLDKSWRGAQNPVRDRSPARGADVIQLEEKR